MVKEWYRKKEFAEYVGVSVATINKWLKNGMPGFKQGKSIQSTMLINRKEADDWLKSWLIKSSKN